MNHEEHTLKVTQIVITYPDGGEHVEWEYELVHPGCPLEKVTFPIYEEEVLEVGKVWKILGDSKIIGEESYEDYACSINKYIETAGWDELEYWAERGPGAFPISLVLEHSDWHNDYDAYLDVGPKIEEPALGGVCIIVPNPDLPPPAESATL